MRALALALLLCACCCAAVQLRLSGRNEIIGLTPSADYNLNRPGLKYMAADTMVQKLNAEDCRSVFKARDYMMPLSLAFSVSNAIPSTLEHPPFAVVTSNRVKFIFEELTREPPRLMYDPRRTNNRHVFVFVGHWDFDTYSKALNALPSERKEFVHVIGCKVLDSTQYDLPRFHGFGLNRYCAMTYLNDAKLHDQYWMVDDNLMHISGMRAQKQEGGNWEQLDDDDYLKRVDKMMTASEKEFANSPFATASWTARGVLPADKEVKDIGGNFPYNKAPNMRKDSFTEQADKTIYQQAYIMDIKKLKGRAFSPLFVLSKEDISFADILTTKEIGWWHNTGIWKLAVDQKYLDNTPYEKSFDLLEKQAKNEKGYETALDMKSEAVSYFTLEALSFKKGTGSASIQDKVITGVGTKFSTEFKGKHFIRLFRHDCKEPKGGENQKQEVEVNEYGEKDCKELGWDTPQISLFEIDKIDSDTQITVMSNPPRDLDNPLREVKGEPILIVAGEKTSREVHIGTGPEITPSLKNKLKQQSSAESQELEERKKKIIEKWEKSEDLEKAAKMKIEMEKSLVPKKGWFGPAIAPYYSSSGTKSIFEMLSALRLKVPVVMTGIDPEKNLEVDQVYKDASRGSERWIMTAVKALEDVMSKCTRLYHNKENELRFLLEQHQKELKELEEQQLQPDYQSKKTLLEEKQEQQRKKLLEDLSGYKDLPKYFEAKSLVFYMVPSRMSTTPIMPIPKAYTVEALFKKRQKPWRPAEKNAPNDGITLSTLKALVVMAEAAKKDGVELKVWRGFSPYQQGDLFDIHSTPEGKALDFEMTGCTRYEARDPPKTCSDNPVYAWLAKNGSKYGFCRTVPKEPFHWEHLGADCKHVDPNHKTEIVVWTRKL